MTMLGAYIPDIILLGYMDEEMQEEKANVHSFKI